MLHACGGIVTRQKRDSQKISILKKGRNFPGIAQTYKVLVDNLVDYNTFYRLTGHKPVLVEDWSVDKLKEIFNG